MGMGGAFVGVSDDANAIFWNPSGVAVSDRGYFTASMAYLYLGANPVLYDGTKDYIAHNYLGLICPAGVIGNFALGIVNLDSKFYKENVVAVTYSRKILSNLFAGINLKLLNWQVSSNEYTWADPDLPWTGVSKFGETIDLGILFYPVEYAGIGLSYENVIPADMGFMTKEIVPANLRAGVAFRTKEVGFFDDLTIAWEFDCRLNKINDGYEFTPKAGIEGWVAKKRVGIRIGGNPNQATLGLSYVYNLNYIVDDIIIEYAFLYPVRIENTFGSHKFSLSLKLL